MSRPLRGSGPISTSIRELQDKAQQNTMQRTVGAQVDSHPLGSQSRPNKSNGGSQRQQPPSIPRYV